MMTWYLYYSSRYECTQPLSYYSILVFTKVQKQMTWQQYRKVFNLIY